MFKGIDAADEKSIVSVSTWLIDNVGMYPEGRVNILMDDMEFSFSRGTAVKFALKLLDLAHTRFYS